MPTEVKNINEIRWRCRRGMLELDLFLNRFVDQGYAHLSAEEMKDFLMILETPDPTLYSWLIGYSIPDQKPLQRICEKIRECSTNQ